MARLDPDDRIALGIEGPAAPEDLHGDGVGLDAGRAAVQRLAHHVLQKALLARIGIELDAREDPVELCPGLVLRWFRQLFRRR